MKRSPSRYTTKPKRKKITHSKQKSVSAYCWVVQFWLWHLRLLLCPSRKCDEQRSFFSLVLLLKAIHAALTCWTFFKIATLGFFAGRWVWAWAARVDLGSCQQYSPPDHKWNR